MDIHIRWMLRRDMPKVLGIEAESFKFPWLEESFICCLRQINSIGMVVEYNNRVVGFMLYDLNKEDIRLLRLAVLPKYLRRGIGTKMIDKLKTKLNPDRRHTLIINVPDNLLGAHLFFQAMGMRAVEVFESEYVFEYVHPELSGPLFDAVEEARKAIRKRT